jgi:uncharacterized membrane protein YedE/YeeE
MHPWILAAAGGVLIGLAAVLMMGGLGRIAGISGIAAGLVTQRSADWSWRLAFVLGLLAAAPLLGLLRGDTGIGAPNVSWPWMALAGGLVGLGTRLGSGCTSGHGVCGIARFSPRSLVATATFMVSGILTVTLVRHLLGGL